MQMTERIYDNVVRYTKIRLTTEMAAALNAVAGEFCVSKVTLLEGILAQVFLAISSSVKGWEHVHASAGLDRVPKIEVKVLKEKEVTPKHRINDEDIKYAKRIRCEMGQSEEMMAARPPEREDKWPD
jgi:hypothetical protein